MSDVVFEIGGSAKGAEAAVKHLQREIAQLQTNLHYAHLSANADAQKYVKQLEEIKAAMKAAGDEALAKQASQFGEQIETLRGRVAGLKEELQAARAKPLAEEFNLAGEAAGFLAQRILPAVTAYASFESAVTMLNQSLATQIERMDRVAELSTTLVPAHAELFRNVGVQSPEEAADLLAETREIMVATGATEEAVAAAIGAASSQRGQRGLEVAIAAAEQAVQILPGAEQDANLLAGALMQVGAATGSDDMQRNLGFMLAVGEVTPVDNPRQQAANLAPALSLVTKTGGTAEEAGALIGALATAVGDITGAETKTAAISLATQLQEYLPEGDLVVGQDARGRPITREGTGLESNAERIAYLQAHPEEAALFLAQASFEKAFQLPIRELLTNAESGTAEDYQSFLAQMPTPEEAATKAAEAAEIYGADPLFAADLAVRQGAARGRALEAGDEALAIKRAARELASQAWEQSRYAFPQEQMERFDWNTQFQSDPEYVRWAIDSIQKAQVEVVERGLTWGQAAFSNLADLGLQDPTTGQITGPAPGNTEEDQAILRNLQESERAALELYERLLEIEQQRSAEPAIPLRPQEGDQASAGGGNAELLSALRGIHRELELQRHERNGPLNPNTFVTQVG